MSLRDMLPPELQKLADGPLIDPPEHAQERSSRPGSAQTDEFEGELPPVAPEQQDALFAAPVDPHTGATRIRIEANERMPPDTAALVGPEGVEGVVILDTEASRAARADGIAKVERGTDQAWAEWALAAVERVCRTHKVFTPDDLWASGLDKPREPRALGPVMLKAKRSGWCEPTGNHVPSRIPTQHQNPITEYRSLIYAGV